MKLLHILLYVLSTSYACMTDVNTHDEIQNEIETEDLWKISSNDNIFTTPDLSFDKTTDLGTIHLDAYKTTKNDQIINDKDPAAYGGLRWVSVGSPNIVAIGINLDGSPKLCKFTDEYFSFSFDMLTVKIREMLKEEVKRVKGIEVSARSFVNLKPNTIECLSKIYDRKTRRRFIIKGKVLHFVRSPYQIKFPYEFDSAETLAVQAKINASSNIDIECTVTAGSQIKKTNSFSLSTQEISDIRLEEKLFGDGNETYVSRDQLSELASEVYSNFNIVEDYQIAGEQFSQDFIENLIALVGENYRSVDFNEALEGLSKFSLDFSGDLDANTISKEISNIFKLEMKGNKTHIIFDESYYKELEKQSSSNSGGSASAGVFGIFGGSATGSHASSKKENWINAGTSLDDQLNELNSYDENSIEFEFQGNKIVPKNLKVAKLHSAGFKKTLTFTRIKNVYYEADFQKKFVLVTEESNAIPDFAVDIVDQINHLKEHSTIVMNEIKQTLNEKFEIANNDIAKNKYEITKNTNGITNNINAITNNRLSFQTELNQTSNALSTKINNQKLTIKQGQWLHINQEDGRYLKGTSVVTIMFNHRFNSPPDVHISNVMLEGKRDEPCFRLDVQKVLNDKFELYIYVWCAGLWHLGVRWIAFGY